MCKYLHMLCCLSPPFRISMSSDFPHYSFRMPNIGFQNLPLNIYIVVFGTAIFVFILSLLFCCYLIRQDQCILQVSSFVVGFVLFYFVLLYLIFALLLWQKSFILSSVLVHHIPSYVVVYFLECSNWKCFTLSRHLSHSN